MTPTTLHHNLNRSGIERTPSECAKLLYDPAILDAAIDSIIADCVNSCADQRAAMHDATERAERLGELWRKGGVS